MPAPSIFHITFAFDFNILQTLIAETARKPIEKNSQTRILVLNRLATKPIVKSPATIPKIFPKITSFSRQEKLYTAQQRSILQLSYCAPFFAVSYLFAPQPRAGTRRFINRIQLSGSFLHRRRRIRHWSC